jgi:glycosyltransferase involved in cell wall biosynthesis
MEMTNHQKGHPRKRVLVLTSTFPRWKDDRDPPFVYELCKRLKNEFDIHVLAPHFKGAALSETLDGMRIRRFRYFYPKWETLCYEGGILANIKQHRFRIGLIPFFLFFQLIATLRILRKNEFDLIHSHWLLPQGVIATIACALLKRTPKILCTSHGGDLYGLQGFLCKWVKSVVTRKSHAVTVVSNSMKEEVVQLGCQRPKIRVIPMGTDLTHTFVPSLRKDNRNKLLFVGRLVEKKGLRYLIDALPDVVRRFPDAHLHIVGDGPDRYALHQRAVHLGIDKHIRFHGAVAHASLPKFYNASDIFVFPSVIGEDGDREGFGLVLVEAMGCSCAVISTNLEAMKDIVIDGITGLVVSQKNSQQLSDNISMLLETPSTRRKMGELARARVLQKFDWDIISSEYKKLIESII